MNDIVVHSDGMDAIEQRPGRARAVRALAELPGLKQGWYHQQTVAAEASPPSPRSWPEFSRDEREIQRRAELLQRCGEPANCVGFDDSLAHSSRTPLAPLCGLPEPQARPPPAPRGTRDLQGNLDGMDRSSSQRNKLSLPVAIRHHGGVSLASSVEHSPIGASMPHFPEPIPVRRASGARVKRL